MSDATELYSTPDEPAEAHETHDDHEEAELPVESIAPADTAEPDDIEPPKPVLPNDTVLSSSLNVYRNLIQQLDGNKQAIQTTRHELAQIRQQIRELSAISKREAHVEDEADSHG